MKIICVVVDLVVVAFLLEVLDLDDVLVEEVLIRIIVQVSIFIIPFFEDMKVMFWVADVVEAFEAFSLEEERFEPVLLLLDFYLVQELLYLYVLEVVEAVFSFSLEEVAADTFLEVNFLKFNALPYEEEVEED